MALSLKDRVKIKQYLLGEPAVEAEREQIESRLLTDDEYFEELCLIREELIDEYVCGELSGGERARFEQNFLTTPERRRSFRLAQALRSHAASTAGQQGATASQAERAGPARGGGRFDARRLPTGLKVAAGLLLASGLSLGLYFALNRPARPSDVERGLETLAAAYREQRPVEARISGLGHAPLPDTRGGADPRADPLLREEAELTLFRALRERPDAQSHHAAGKVYLTRRDFNNAIKELEAALKDEPSSAAIQSDLGAAWLERGKAEAARGEEDASVVSFATGLKHLTAALETEPKLAEALYNRGLVNMNLLAWQQAEEDWKAFLELDSSSPWAEEARRNLETVRARSGAVSHNGERIFQDFLAAWRAADDEAAWRLITRNRDFTGSPIENRLLDEYLDAAAGGRDQEADERLRALSFAARLEADRGGDQFASDLLKLYASAGPERRRALLAARRLLNAGHAQLQPMPAAAREFYAGARRLFEQNGDAHGALYVSYPVGHSYLLQANSKAGLAEFEALARECEARRYRWLLGQTLNAIANAHIGLNNYSVALEHSKRSLEILSAIDDVAGVTKANDQLGIEYQRLGDYRKALAFHRRSLLLAGEKFPGRLALWRAYFTAALSLHALGLEDAAINYTKEALRLAEELQSPLETSRCHISLALMHGAKRSRGAALDSVRLAFESAGRIPDPDVRTAALGYAYLQQGNLHRLAGDFHQAVASYDQAIDFYRRLNFLAFSYAAHKGKFLACVAQPGGCASVGQELETALDLFEQHRQKILEISNKFSFIDTEQNVYDVAIDSAFSLAGDKYKSFDYSERYRAQMMFGLKLANERWRAVDGAAGRDASATAQAYNTSQVMGGMPESARIVQYSVLEDKLLIWLITKTDVKVFRQEISAKELGEKVRGYLRLISEPRAGGEEDERREAALLYDILIRPVNPLLKADPRAAPHRETLVCIVPDKILNYLPFAALAPAEGRYLIEDYALVYSPSSTRFVMATKAARSAFESAGGRAERLLSVGDPRFDARAFPNFRRLPSADAEARDVAGYYGRAASVFTDDKATKARVLLVMETADVVHLAMHSITDEQSPLYSKLLLAKDSTRNEPADGDGALLTQELYGRDFSRMRLLILSSCRTTAERYYGGEGMIGIAHPFMQGGVPLVVASLWAVDSGSTRELMVELHRLRKQGALPTAVALKRAQERMLADPHKEHRRPYYWAPFVAVGGDTAF